MRPEISVILPFLNARDYIREAVYSILRSTDVDFELLLIDNGSTDDSVATITEVLQTDSRVKMHTCSEPGIVAALNTGLRHARAALIARMDSDDICDPHRLCLQRNLMTDQKDTALVSCLVTPLTDSPLSCGTRLYLQWVNECNTHRQILRGLFIESPLPHPTVMFRKELVERLGGYREFDGPEDYDLWLRMACAGAKFSKISLPLLQWRIHSGSLSRISERYRRQAFNLAKFEHVAKMISEARIGRGKSIRIWGAGKNGGKLFRVLADHRIPVDAFIDIDPLKIGTCRHGRPVLSIDAVDRAAQPYFYICAVGNRGAREKLEAFFVHKGLVELEDYVLL